MRRKAAAGEDEGHRVHEPEGVSRVHEDLEELAVVELGDEAREGPHPALEPPGIAREARGRRSGRRGTPSRISSAAISPDRHGEEHARGEDRVHEGHRVAHAQEAVARRWAPPRRRSSPRCTSASPAARPRRFSRTRSHRSTMAWKRSSGEPSRPFGPCASGARSPRWSRRGRAGCTRTSPPERCRSGRCPLPGPASAWPPGSRRRSPPCRARAWARAGPGARRESRRARWRPRGSGRAACARPRASLTRAVTPSASKATFSTVTGWSRRAPCAHRVVEEHLVELRAVHVEGEVRPRPPFAEGEGGLAIELLVVEGHAELVQEAMRLDLVEDAQARRGSACSWARATRPP